MLYEIRNMKKAFHNNYLYTLECLKLISNYSNIIGPLVEIGNMKASQYHLIADLIPDLADFKVVFRSVNFGLLNENIDILKRMKKYDSLRVFFGNSNSLIYEYGNNSRTLNADFRIICDFSYGWSQNEPITQVEHCEFLKSDEKLSVARKILKKLFEEIGVDSQDKIDRISRELVFSDKKIVDESGLIFKGLHSSERLVDDPNGIKRVEIINNAFAVCFSAKKINDTFKFFLEIALSLGELKGWQEEIYGNNSVVDSLISCLPNSEVLISYSNFHPFSETQTTLKYIREKSKQDYSQRSRELLEKCVLSEFRIRRLLEFEPFFDCDFLKIMWNTLGCWCIDLENTLKPDITGFSNNSIEVVRESKSSESHIYLEIDSTLPIKKVKDAIEKRVGVKLKTIYI